MGSSTAIAQKKILSPPSFNASIEWLHNFKARSGIKYAKYLGEISSTDLLAADFFPEIANQINQEGGYIMDQILNCNETSFREKNQLNPHLSLTKKNRQKV